MKRIYRQILKETLHEEIIKTRAELGWTQEQMAEMIYYTKTNIKTISR